jgi:hypothetical protein
MDGDDNFGLDPAALYRQHEGKRLFGLKHSQLAEAIRSGKIPPPFAVLEGGRAKGWIGAQIIAHRRQRMAAAEQQRTAAKQEAPKTKRQQRTEATP